MQILDTSKDLKCKNEKEIIEIKNENLPVHLSCINKKLLHIIILIVLLIIIFSSISIVIYILNNHDKQKNIHCNDGYFLEINENKCAKCSLLNCKKCEGSVKNNTCISCLSSYKTKLLNNRIISCELDELKEINDSNFRYSDLSDEKIEESEKNENISGNYTENEENYNTDNIFKSNQLMNYLQNNETSMDIVDSTTIFNELSEFQIHNPEKESKEETTFSILECPPGYFRNPENNTCNECSVLNCEICHWELNNDLCTSCIERFIPSYQNNYIISCDYCESGEKDKCLECDINNFVCSECNEGFQLSEGKCISEYSFEAIYETNSYNQNILLINPQSLYYVNEMVVDGENMAPQSFINIHSPGNHTIYFKIDNNTNSFSKMFANVTNLISIYFYSNFNTENITSMESMFNNCRALTSIHLSNFNTTNVFLMNEMFSNCISLKSLDLSNFNTGIVREFYQMFFNCYSLTSLIVSNFNTLFAEDMDEMFFSCYSLTSLNLSSFINFFDCRYIFYLINSNVTIYINSDFHGILREKGLTNGLRFIL